VVLASFLVLFIAQPGTSRDLPLPQSQESAPGPPRTTPSNTGTATGRYTTVLLGEKITDYGVKLGFTDLLTSNKVFVEILYTDVKTSAEAEDIFNKELIGATKIIERGEKKDRKGNRIGGRARIIIPSKTPGEMVHAILWTAGNNFREIRSQSLADILRLERGYRY
jgi:hypothetical protein